MSAIFGGIRIAQSIYALKDTDVRLFPASKNRSARIRKKLIKRFGGEFKKVPCVFSLPNGDLIAHPAMHAELVAKINARRPS